MQKQTTNPGIKSPFTGIITLASTILLTACLGKNVSFNSTDAQVSVDENTAGVFWQAKAQIQGEPANNLRYKISGNDSGLFAINSMSGELTFNTPADFEAPKDADKNNEYSVDIEANATASSAIQHVQILVKDVSKPTLSLEKPRPNENIGTEKPGSIETETAVRFFDAESNTPIKDGSVTLNTSPLIQDAANLQLWKGKITVPEGGADVALAGFSADKTPVKSATKVFNKRDSINPSYLGVTPEKYLIFFDPARSKLGKLSPSDKLWINYFTEASLNNYYPIFDWNPRLETIYAVNNNTGKLKALVAKSATPSLFSAGCIPNTLSITSDYANNRVISLTRNGTPGVSTYRVLAVDTDDTKAFAHAESNSETPCGPAITQLILDIPSTEVPGTFKYFNFHRASKTYIISDERSINNIQQTVVQGFGENGQKKFEAIISGDSSNMAVNQAAGLVYIAENHSSANGKIKAISIDTGEVRDAVESYGTSNLGAYSNIQMDNFNKRLYIGDDVSDSIFVVDLATHGMSELVFGPAAVYGSDIEN